MQYLGSCPLNKPSVRYLKKKNLILIKFYNPVEHNVKKHSKNRKMLSLKIFDNKYKKIYISKFMLED
jgi:hypothetical protein